MAVTYAQTFFLSWFPSYLTVTRHLAQADMALVSGIPWILGAAGFAGGGFLSDYAARKLPARLRGRKLLLSACLVPAGICIALVPLVGSTQVAIALMSAAIGFLYLGGPNYFATVHQVVPPQNFGSAVGLLAFFSTIAGFLAPTLTGLVVKVTASYTLAFAVTAAFLLAAALVFTTCAGEPGRTGL
jgi:sugar phosphate permease